MSQYCEIAGQITNCTDNCKSCLEEETETHEIEVGDKVLYIDKDSKEDKESDFS